MGYHRAGFDEIVGVDHVSMPRYPSEFVQVDALEYLAEHGHEYDAIHASPPCQGYSIMHNLPWLRGREYPLLILPTIEMLEGLGKPYVVENVMGARHGSKTLKKRGLESHWLKAGWLCGGMFGLPFYRHRLFATNWLWLAPGHPKHVGVIRPGPLFGSNGGWLAKMVYGLPSESWPGRRDSADRITIVKGNGAQGNGVGIGHAKGWRLAAEAMGIDWMKRDELTQAIPPAYTEFIGWQLLRIAACAGARR